MKFLDGLKRLFHAPYTTWFVLALPSFPLLADIGVHERYYAEIMYESGLLSVQLLVLALVITPLMHIMRSVKPALSILRWFQKRRRAIGVASFGYAALHTFFYIRESGSLEVVLLELVEIDLALGWAAMVLMTLLAITSNNVSVRMLGSKWKIVQRAVYFAALLTALHWIWIDQFLNDLLMWAVPIVTLQIIRIGKNTFLRYVVPRPVINGE